jgi:hypothetical protein
MSEGTRYRAKFRGGPWDGDYWSSDKGLPPILRLVLPSFFDAQIFTEGMMIPVSGGEVTFAYYELQIERAPGLPDRLYYQHV